MLSNVAYSDSVTHLVAGLINTAGFLPLETRFAETKNTPAEPGCLSLTRCRDFLRIALEDVFGFYTPITSWLRATIKSLVSCFRADQVGVFPILLIEGVK